MKWERIYTKNKEYEGSLNGICTTYKVKGRKRARKEREKER